MTCPLGAQFTPDGVRFRLHAPGQQTVRLHVDGTVVEMQALGEGWHEVVLGVHPGTRYRFELEDGLLVPDPASRFQPEDCHGPLGSWTPTAMVWRDTDWRGRPWHEAILYETACRHLHRGRDLPRGHRPAGRSGRPGVTGIELMPLSRIFPVPATGL